jgi:hypothetical protein
VHVDELWPRFHRVRPRTNMLEPLASIARNCRHIVGIDTEVDSIDMVFIEGKRDRTRDHSGAKAQLAAVRGDEHAGQTARQVGPYLADLDMTDWLSRGQQRGKDGSGVRLGCAVKVALEPAFVQRITEERTAPLPVGFRCGTHEMRRLKSLLSNGRSVISAGFFFISIPQPSLSW